MTGKKKTGFFRSWISYRRFRKLDAQQRRIVFYAESGQDWHHLAPLIHQLTEVIDTPVCYVSSDPDDPGLHQDNPRLTAVYIREGMFQILFFQFLKADVLVLTMLDLNCFQLKRSIHPVHYIYVFHAMGSTHMVDFASSYDHYDTIFCTGPHQKKEIQEREALKHLPAKQLVDHGYARLEQLMAENQAYHRAPADGITVLLAPTWGDTSILNTMGEQLVAMLLDAGFRVILRPHYQTLKLSPHVTAAILDRFRNHEHLEYIHRMGETDSLFRSDILICDWSSMSMEYALGLEKPVLFIDVPKRVRNPDYGELGIEPMEITIRNHVGRVVSPDALDTVPSLIQELVNHPEAFRQQIEALRNNVVFNVGQSAEIGAREIVRIAEIQHRSTQGQETL